VEINFIEELDVLEENNYSGIVKVHVDDNYITNENFTKICKLKNLTHLDLYNCQINHIPKDIYNLTNLQFLGFGANNLVKISKKIKNLTKLTTLQLLDNQLTHIPSEIYSLPNLSVLSLICNKLKTVDKEIKKIKLVEISTSTYDNLDNLQDVEYLQINRLHIPLLNLPLTLREIRLYKPYIINIKLPFNCKLYIDDVLCEN
jgi:Leucine-rich repeat (LRR) protein